MNKCPQCKSYWDETNQLMICMICGYEPPDYDESDDNCEDLT